MNEEEKQGEYELEPVEMHPEMYATDLFGNSVEAPKDEEEDVIGPKARAEFNIWALTDAIGARKKRDAWVLYRKALASGLVPEEVYYKVVWQVKTLLTAQKTNSVAETDMKPFPYNKAKSSLKNFKPGELEQMSEALVLGYHAVRRGEGEMETLVEKMLLRL
jgi:hypothetical protein